VYTNEQVAILVKRLDAKIDALLAGGHTIVGAPVGPITIASPVTIPDKGERTPKYACSKHADHKGGKGFTANGRADHAKWCDGTWSEIASA
jgi:hypothetical protein